MRAWLGLFCRDYHVEADGGMNCTGHLVLWLVLCIGSVGVATNEGRKAFK